MGDLWVQLIARSPGDAARLDNDVNRKRRDDDRAGYTKLLRDDPKNPLRHDAVAMLYLQGGRAEDAAVEWRESLKLNPESAPAHYNLGLALSALRRFDEARGEFQEAVRLDPEYAEAHNNLGAMLHIFGKLDEAAEHYRRAATIRPDNAEALNNLGRLLSQQGHLSEAVDRFHQALALSADFASALSGLAWIRATSGPPFFDANEARQLAERADALTAHRDPGVLDALAAAYAATGSFNQAVVTARLAAQLAAGAQMTNLAEEARQRLTLYERRERYVAKP
jgi:Tfp pilus assembly protein PilF